MLAPSTILQNRYRILRELGHGGMGTVYEALDQRVDCIVALKETLIGADLQARSAFQREAALLANLRHPALPKVMDYFSDGDGEFLVMEFIPGHDLAELLELRDQPFPQERVIRWAEDVLKVIEYLHTRHPPILHRDIKPSNLKITKQNELFLLDFGLAKGAAGQMATLETSKSVLGYTPIYSPLEQIHGRGTDPRSDLYALGATLYHLLTGHPPIDAPTRFLAVEEEEADPLVPAHKLNSQISLPVSAVIEHAMAMRRRLRPSTASEMRQELLGAIAAISEKATLPLRKADVEPIRPAPSATLPPPPPAPLVEKTPQPGAIKTLPVHEFLRRDTGPIAPTATSSGEQRASPNWAVRAVVATVALMVIAAIGLLVWNLLSRPQPTNTGNQPTTVNTPAPPADMAYVPGGDFMMGRDDGDEYERPAHRVTVKAFFVDRDEVINGSYNNFLEQNSGHPRPQSLQGAFFGEQPITGVSWDDANEYCKTAGKRLPTEEEWEFAARGTDGRRYPWGNDWKPGLANAAGASKDVTAVGAYKGESPFGAKDMVGNAWEWTSSKLVAYPGGQLPTRPTGDLRVIRGGSYDSDKDTATTTYRRGYPARGNYDYNKTGFRCVKDVSQ